MPVKSNAPISIGPGFQQRGIASYWDFGYGGNYVHIKTTIPHESYIMPMIELIGYNYGTAAPIRMAFVIYSYFYMIYSWQNAYSGVTGDGVYLSSDNYYVLRVYAGSMYFCGFSMDAYSVAGNGAQVEIGVLAMANGGSGNIY